LRLVIPRSEATRNLSVGLGQKQGKEVVFRAVAAFAKPETYEALKRRGVKYAIRLPANDSLEGDMAELRTGPADSR
jgi:hypothetical protein